MTSKKFYLEDITDSDLRNGTMNYEQLINLDNLSTTQIAPEVANVMIRLSQSPTGNPASRHILGEKARNLIDEARQNIADLIGADKRNIVFTSGATEANNLAILGAAKAVKEENKHIITCQAEHDSVLKPCNYLENLGVEITCLPVSGDCQIDSNELFDSITDKTILITISLANNETGTVNTIKKINSLAKLRGIPIHVDAAQAIGKINVNLNNLNIDMMSISAHKFHGPTGVGALYINRNASKVLPLMYGGSQEFGLRPGTPNILGIVGFGKAAEIADKNQNNSEYQLSLLRDYFEQQLTNRIDDIIIHCRKFPRLPNASSFAVKGVDSSLLINLLPELILSNRAACSSEKDDSSHVLTAMRLPKDVIKSTIRVGLSRFTTQDEIDKAIDLFSKVVKKIRA